MTGWACGLISLGGLAWGLDLGSISGGLSGARQEFNLSQSEAGIFVGLLSAGELVGSTMVGLLSDQYGRRYALLFTDALFIGSALALGGAQSKEALFAGRFCAGLAVGASLVAQISWASEVAPSRTRGIVTATYELAIGLGFVASFASFAAAKGNWRLLFALPAIPAFVQLICVAVKGPESPPWLDSIGKTREAREELVAIYAVFGRDAAAAPPPQTRRRRPAEAPTSRWDRTLVAWIGPWACLVFFGWLTFFTGGLNLTVFVVDVFSAAGISQKKVANVTLGLGLVKFVTTAFAVATVDTYGRKPLLTRGVLATTLCAAAVSILFATNPIAAGWTIVPLCYIYVAAFQLSFGTCNFIFLGELLPSEVKGRFILALKFPVTAFQFASQYIFARALTTTRTLAILFAGHALCALLGFLFVVFAFVETKQKSPDEIRQDLLQTPAFRAMRACCSRQHARVGEEEDDENRLTLPGLATPPRGEPVDGDKEQWDDDRKDDQGSSDGDFVNIELTATNAPRYELVVDECKAFV